MTRAARAGLLVVAGVQTGLLLAALAFAACGRTPPSGARTVPAPTASASTPPQVPLSIAVGPIPGPPTQLQPMPNPYADDRTATAEGRQLFIRFNCSGCHGGRAGGGMGPSLRDVDWLYGNTDEQIFSSIVQGRAHGMPSWQTRLTPEQTWKLVTYVKSLRTPNEPQAPSE